MARSTSPAFLPFLLGAALLFATAGLVGVVMGKDPSPVVVEPDAKPAGGAQLATFALG